MTDKIKALILIAIVIFGVVATILLMWSATQADHRPLYRRISALERENTAQWQRIRELEIMLCEPEMIDCGK